MIDITDVTPISVLTPKHIGQNLYIDGVVIDVDYDTNKIVLAEPDEYTKTFRKTISVEGISGHIKPEHYIIVNGQVECVKYLGGKPRGFTVLGRHRTRRRI